MLTLPEGVHFFERGWLSSNCTLLVDCHSAIMIDSGYHTHAAQTAALVAPFFDSKQALTLINTHLHSDHCGGNAFMQHLYPQLRTLTPPAHLASVRQWDPVALSYKPTGQHCPEFSVSGPISNGDFFTVGKLTWKAYSAPGHDPNSLVIFCDELKILISADALWANGFGVVFPELEGTEAFDEVRSTLQLIEELKPKTVLPGHGALFTDVEHALSNARSRLDSFIKNPVKHANYAVKVLLKFKLLEQQSMPIASLLEWARETPYFDLIHQRYFASTKFDAWIYAVCNQLEMSKACTIDNGVVINA
jgi:glyoxylase-like metal-dependent hydrolase (beta-lactamase superfamily II)